MPALTTPTGLATEGRIQSRYQKYPKKDKFRAIAISDFFPGLLDTRHQIHSFRFQLEGCLSIQALFLSWVLTECLNPKAILVYHKLNWIVLLCDFSYWHSFRKDSTDGWMSLTSYYIISLTALLSLSMKNWTKQKLFSFSHHVIINSIQHAYT